MNARYEERQQPAARLPGEELGSLYWKYFEVVPADSDELRLLTRRLRYQVYCSERHFEDENVDRMEMDKFDLHAEAAILNHRPTATPAGRG